MPGGAYCPLETIKGAKMCIGGTEIKRSYDVHGDGNVAVLHREIQNQVPFCLFHEREIPFVTRGGIFFCVCVCVCVRVCV